jgi:hypothetical protein
VLKPMTVDVGAYQLKPWTYNQFPDQCYNQTTVIFEIQVMDLSSLSHLHTHCVRSEAIIISLSQLQGDQLSLNDVTALQSPFTHEET